MINFRRVATDLTAEKTVNELKVIPKQLINIACQTGIEIYCFNKSCYPSWIGLMEKDQFDDGRSTDDTACFLTDKKAIILYDWDMDEEEGFSTVLHEFGHAIDYALGLRTGKGTFLSTIDSNIYSGWMKGNALDSYADINPREYFAQAFMAYYTNKLTTYKPWSYRAHTKEELFAKDNDMYMYLLNMDKQTRELR